MNKFPKTCGAGRAGGADARLCDYDGAPPSCVCAPEKVLPRRLRAVCQNVVFTVRKR